MNTENLTELLGSVEQYYSEKLRVHGASARGVDWKDRDSQLLRFDQLLKIRRSEGPFTLNDIGCGVGCLAQRLQALQTSFEYYGLDISAEMIAAAEARFTGHRNIHFHTRTADIPQSDYSVASGIFNVRLKNGLELWEAYIDRTLDEMDRLSRKGFAFNMLSHYADADKKRPDLHYADPSFYFDLCKRRYARNVVLLHDYDLYEFTILVRKTL